MSVQVFLQGKLLGIEELLLAPTDQEDQAAVFQGRSRWVALLAEVLPRALLSDLGLAHILLGSSGGGQFLAVLPEESRGAANEFLVSAAAYVSKLSGGHVSLKWVFTENLGDWSDVRKRLSEEMRRLRGTPMAAGWDDAAVVSAAPADFYFATVLGPAFRDANTVAWAPDRDERIVPGGGKYAWPLGAHGEIGIARHTSLDDSGASPASTEVLASRAQGRKTWGVLRGDVDQFGIRLRRLTTIEEHIQLSIMYKQFFAGEIEVLSSMPEFWQRVTVLYSGGDDFAVFGAWDALIPFARELQRLFQRFAEENLKEFPGAEGKTITMALALADSEDATLASVFKEAGLRLEAAKSADRDSFWLLGRLLEWKQLNDASDLKDSLTRMVSEHELSPHYLREVSGVYRESQHRMSRRQARKTGERPWRYVRRIQRILTGAQEIDESDKASARDRAFAKDCSSVITSLVGHRGGYLKLRPAGRVALEWARLSTEG
jgi:CRISPR-associated protein Csm1